MADPRSPAPDPLGDPDQLDVLIVGCGTAGAAAAQACARAGLSVLALDRRPLDQAGARWINGVPAWAYAAADLDPPEHPELAGDADVFHLVAGWGPTRVTIRSSAVLEIDMRHLVARLQRIAVEHGAELRGEVKVLGFRAEPSGVLLRTDQGSFRARYLVDASGMTGLQALGKEPVRKDLICTAAQQVHDLADPQAAAAWLAEHDAEDGEVVCFAGVAGGYSIVNVRVHAGSPHGPEVSLLTGSVPATGVDSGQVLLDRFLAEHPWVGAKQFGGARPIPIDQPRGVLGRGRVALVGDSGRQVFAAHGSGIAAQLVAGKLLADTLAAGGRPEDYSVAWHRQWGGSFASAALFAEFSRALTVDEFTRLMASGIMSEPVISASLAQQDPVPDLQVMASLVRGAWANRSLLRRLAPVVARMVRLHAHHRRMPTDPARWPAWETKRQGILGRVPA